MRFKSYSDENPPRRGNAKKIYQAMKAQGFKVWDLHYNPNCWGRGAILGWGTWACHVSDGEESLECWCGWDDERGAYLQGSGAPFACFWLTAAPNNKSLERSDSVAEDSEA